MKSKKTKAKSKKKVKVTKKSTPKQLPENIIESEFQENDDLPNEQIDIIENEDEYNEDSFGDNDNEVDELDEEDDEDHEDIDDELTNEVDTDIVNECIYNNDDQLDEEDHEMVFDDDNDETLSEIIPADKRISKAILFKYERVRLICDRTQQLTLGAKPMVKNVEGLTEKQIAELELKMNVIPLIIQRPLPNGKKERWYIDELKHE